MIRLSQAVQRAGAPAQAAELLATAAAVFGQLTHLHPTLPPPAKLSPGHLPPTGALAEALDKALRILSASQDEPGVMEAAALVALLDRIATEDRSPSPEVLMLVGIDAEGWGLVWLTWLPDAAAGVVGDLKEAA